MSLSAVPPPEKEKNVRLERLRTLFPEGSEDLSWGGGGLWFPNFQHRTFDVRILSQVLPRRCDTLSHSRSSSTLNIEGKLFHGCVCLFFACLLVVV